MALTLVEHHLQLCVAASIRFKKVVTKARFEPYLAKAALEPTLNIEVAYSCHHVSLCTHIAWLKKVVEADINIVKDINSEKGRPSY